MSLADGPRPGGRAARSPVCRLVAALLLAAAATLVSGCSSGTSGTSGTSVPGTTPATSSGAVIRSVGPAEFAREIASGRRYLVNVHTPDEGSIKGTDAAIPFDQIGDRAAELPKNRSAPLAVYCMTGNMSKDAVARLNTLGYTDIVELRGGMTAWRADDRALLPPAAD